MMDATAPAIEATKSAEKFVSRMYVLMQGWRTLRPGGLGVVGELEDVLLGDGGTTEELKMKVQYRFMGRECYEGSENRRCLRVFGCNGRWVPAEKLVNLRMNRAMLMPKIRGSRREAAQNSKPQH